MVSMFADDNLIFLIGFYNLFKMVVAILKEFSFSSDCQINLSKSQPLLSAGNGKKA